MFNQLLIPLDESPLAERAIPTVIAIARACHSNVDVMLVHTPFPFAGFPDLPADANAWMKETRYVERVARRIEAETQVATTHAVLRGRPAEIICQRAWEIHADLIVLTSHGRTGLSRAWLGSVADDVLRRSRVPVLMLRPGEGGENEATAVAPAAEPARFQNVLVALDGSSYANETLAPAASLARAMGGSVTLLRVVQPIPSIDAVSNGVSLVTPELQDVPATKRVVAEAKEQLNALAHGLTADLGVSVTVAVTVESRVAHSILEFANAHHADVIAMSTHGRGASRLLVGSIADKIIRGSTVPVLLCRPVAVAEGRALLDAESVADQLPAIAPG
jgi:nucleotide-binding universal stress UspA family protein